MGRKGVSKPIAPPTLLYLLSWSFEPGMVLVVGCYSPRRQGKHEEKEGLLMKHRTERTLEAKAPHRSASGTHRS